MHKIVGKLTEYSLRLAGQRRICVKSLAN